MTASQLINELLKIPASKRSQYTVVITEQGVPKEVLVYRDEKKVVIR